MCIVEFLQIPEDITRVIQNPTKFGPDDAIAALDACSNCLERGPLGTNFSEFAWPGIKQTLIDNPQWEET